MSIECCRAPGGDCCTSDEFQAAYVTWDTSNSDSLKQPYRIKYETESSVVRKHKKIESGLVYIRVNRLKEGRVRRDMRSNIVAYTVGNETGCEPNEEADSCNGALRDDTEYVVALATCSAGGCVVTEYIATPISTGENFLRILSSSIYMSKALI